MKRLVALLILFSLASGFLALPMPAAAQNAKWTFMVYLDADNNLEDIGIDNFVAMAKVGSTNEVKIVVQFDRATGGDSRYGDWSTTKRYLVQKDMIPDASSALQDLGEQNMADPTTLSDFVIWSIATYPADHYFLDIWDHGLGWQGVAVDDMPGGGDRLTAPELGQALSSVAAYLGRPLDILANDACRMTLEIMYEAAPHVRYLVGSEKDEPVEGWPYDRVLGDLSVNPSKTPIDLAKTLVDEYVDFYQAGSSYSVTMALVNSSALPQLVGSLSSLVSAVNFTLPYYVGLVSQARNESEHYEGNQCVMPQAGDDYDLYDLTMKLRTRLQSGRVMTSAIDLLASIERAVLYERHMDLPSAINCVRATNAHGLSIFYPWDIGSRIAAYSQLALSRDSLWDEHLTTYHNGTGLGVNLTASLTPMDADSDGLMDSADLRYVSSADGDVILDKYLDLELSSSNVYIVSASVAYVEHLLLPTPGSYLIFLTYRQAGQTMNISWFPPVLVGANITFRGFIRDSYGREFLGANVTLRNLRTGEELNATMTGGLYTFSVFYPVWMTDGDILRIVATGDGRIASFEVTFGFHGRKLFWRDIYLPAGNQEVDEGSLFNGYWQLLLIPAAALAIEIALVILVVSTGRRSKKRSERPDRPL